MIGYKYLEDNEISVKGVIHIGAHRGEEINEHVDLGAEKIIWVEANPDVYSELIANISKDKRSEQFFFNNLCSDTNGKQTNFNIIYGPDASYMSGNKGCSSILEPVGRFEGWKRNTITMPTITLDTLMYVNGFDAKDFDLLEIDAQGAELYILKGAKNTLKSIKYASIEVTDSNPDYANSPLSSDIIKFMEENGFDYIETKYLEQNWGDALFVRTDK